MSADNWAICPRCLAKAYHETDVQIQRVESLYGNVPVEEFDAARAALVDVEPETYRTFREDYEFYSHDGKVEAHYKGHCQTCSLHCELEAERTFWSPGDPLS